MLFVCDYSELLKELEEELRDGAVTLMTVIQVLRTDNPAYENYHPVVDWYYDDKSQMGDFELRPEYSRIVLKRLKEEKMKYLSIKHKLEKIKVCELIREMEDYSHTRIIEA